MNFDPHILRHPTDESAGDESMLSSQAFHARGVNLDTVRERLTETHAQLSIISARFPGQRFPFPELVFELLEPHHAVDAVYLESSNLLEVEIAYPLVRLPLGTTKSTLAIVTTSDARPEALIPLPPVWTESFNIRKFTSLPDSRAARMGHVDAIIVDQTHPQAADIQRRLEQKLTCAYVAMQDVSKDVLHHFEKANSSLDECLTQLGRTSALTPGGASLSISSKFELLMKELLQKAPSDPLLTRVVLMRVSHEVLPAMRGCRSPFGLAFREADEALILPLLYFHRDEFALLQEIKALAISPRAAVSYFGANALHMRFFSNYDQADVLGMPHLLRTILPYLDKRLDQFVLHELHRDEAVAAKAELRQYVRGLLNGLVMMADFGAFDQHLTLTQRNPRRHVALDPQALELFEVSEVQFYSEMQTLGSQLLEVMRKAKYFLPEEFTQEIPMWSEYFHGYYGNDEMATVIRHNMSRDESEWISVADVFTGATNRDLESYYRTHRAQRPRALHTQPSEAKNRQDRLRSQFSNDAREHVLHSREVWRRVMCLINADPAVQPQLDKLIAFRGNAALARSGELFAQVAEESPPGSLARPLFTSLAEFSTRFPPPGDSKTGLLKYCEEGDRLKRLLSNYIEAQAEFEVFPAERKLSIRLCLDVFLDHMAKANRRGRPASRPTSL